MSEVLDYIYQQEGKEREIMLLLHGMLTDEFGLQDKIRYRVPFYFGRTWIVYMNPQKKGGIELAFVRANELSDELGLLDFRDRKQVAGILYLAARDVDFEALRLLLHEAVLLDDTTPYASKRK